ncbi:hypothetical protein [Rahnella woolbedingensis]|uniref:Uncharacterized protein n=1 Tax=Rahnella woolbedingensis TaxID=1510574 RepID=A0A419NEJ4_9GAMM|nr:hypothetical protein [Rahnella woolbedingensis]RJT47193.1 hypothetical protein D6C13_02195 [Rahnella woolbedingensis]
MTDTTGIKALRERLVSLNRTYGLISSPATMEQANTSAHMFVKAGGIHHILAALDQLEAERQRADANEGYFKEMEKYADKLEKAGLQLEAEIAELKGDHVPVGVWCIQEVTDDDGGLSRTEFLSVTDGVKIPKDAPLFTAPQKPVGLRQIGSIDHDGGGFAEYFIEFTDSAQVGQAVYVID